MAARKSKARRRNGSRPSDFDRKLSSLKAIQGSRPSDFDLKQLFAAVDKIKARQGAKPSSKAPKRRKKTGVKLTQRTRR